MPAAAGRGNVGLLRPFAPSVPGLSSRGPVLADLCLMIDLCPAHASVVLACFRRAALPVSGSVLRTSGCLNPCCPLAVVRLDPKVIFDLMVIFGPQDLVVHLGLVVLDLLIPLDLVVP